MVTGGVGRHAGRVPLAMASVIECDNPPLLSPQRIPPVELRSDPDAESSSWYKTPARRLHDAIQECADLDQELKILETSGHTRVGAFAKPLVMKQNAKTSSKTVKSANARGKSTSGPRTPEIQDENSEANEEEDESSDPFINQFYDEQGRTLCEQLLRGRMRILALVKLVHGQHSTSKAQAELELAEAYARMNLWKQADLHASCAASLLRSIEVESQKEGGTTGGKAAAERQENGKLLQRALEFFYEAQCDEAARGRVDANELLEFLLQDEAARKRNQLLNAVFERTSLENAFDSDQTLHWQQLILRLEAETEDGIVPFHTFLDRLQGVNSDFSNRKSSSALYVQALCTSLQRVLNRVNYHSLTWTEILALGTNGKLQLPSNEEDPGVDDDSPTVLMSRVDILLSRVFLRRGQLEEAVRYAQVALASREKMSPDSAELVSFYLVVAEALARQGSRCLRSRALGELELVSASGGAMLSKKEAEGRARVALLQELIAKPPPLTLSGGHPGSDLETSARSHVEEALENCNRAWELQERHFGGDHVTTAAVHVSLAQVHLLRCEDQSIHETADQEAATGQAVRSLIAAIGIYEKACSGTVPASAFLRLELAKLYQQQKNNLDKARAEYNLVGRFFTSFAREFAGSESTKRECCTLALDAFQQWLVITRRARLRASSSLEDQQEVLAEMHAACVAGYGEFSVEACESAAALARMLHHIAVSRDGQLAGQSEVEDKLRAAVKLLRSSSYIAECLLGAGDRRSQKLRKDTLEVEAQLRSTVVGEEDDGDGHAWLII
ncbi:hypothetical protein PHYBOEH_009475 [Phytophthora boehmeriae]|uniref:Uncharacterized protein n=1 Tax=Phytophthora boehmeriae TaxID=109152 RepID=A0A8T1X7B0_9STRA|nr:hypothetical protein PHYBOEH_009475 [Phytophthora boehmeriae]